MNRCLSVPRQAALVTVKKGLYNRSRGRDDQLSDHDSVAASFPPVRA